MGVATDPWRVYKAWFWAAAAYNLLWGTLIGLKPDLLLDWMGMTPSQQAAAGPLPPILAACIGMFVGVYAIGYLCVALDPPRFWPFAFLGLCGKVLGPMGWALHHALGHLSWHALWVNVFNDLIWWPAFIGLLLTVRREGRVNSHFESPSLTENIERVAVGIAVALPADAREEHPKSLRRRSRKKSER